MQQDTIRRYQSWIVNYSLVKSRVYRFSQTVRAYFNLKEFRKWFPTFFAEFDKDAHIFNTPIYMLSPLSYSLTHTTFTKTTVSAIIWNNAYRNVSWHNTEMSHACSCDSKSGFISITLLLLLWQSIWITARRVKDKPKTWQESEETLAILFTIIKVEPNMYLLLFTLQYLKILDTQNFHRHGDNLSQLLSNNDSDIFKSQNTKEAQR